MSRPAGPRIRLVMANLLHTLRRDPRSYSLRPAVDGGVSLPQPTGPALSYAAVTVLGITPAGLRISDSGPAFSLAQARFQQRRLLPARPLPLPAQYALELALHTLLGPTAPPHLTTPDMIALLGEARKRSSISKHAGYFAKWASFALRRHLAVLPVAPLEFASFLLESAREDSTASPTMSRCSAVRFFATLSGTPNPMDHVLCGTIREALCRRLGLAAKKKLPLLQRDVDAIITRQLGSDHQLATLLTCFRIALMYEGCLRWHDLDQICFGDIIVTATYLRIFVQSAKTDAYRHGQWVTIAVSDSPTAASTLLRQVLEALALLWRAITPQTRKLLVDAIPNRAPSAALATDTLPLADLPLNFAISTRTGLPDFSATLSYHSYLNTVKAWASQAGLPADDIGTHSLRRGVTSDWALLGIPDRLRREHGRWRSERVADGYIDESINVHLKLRAFRDVRAASLLPPAPDLDVRCATSAADPVSPAPPATVRRSARTRRPKKPYDGHMD